MVKPLRTLALLVALAVAAAGCFPGGHGWKCDADSECDKGLVCKKFGSLFESRACVSPGTTQIRSSNVYGWVGLVLFWGAAGIAGVTALFIAYGVALDAIQSRKRRR